MPDVDSFFEGMNVLETKPPKQADKPVAQAGQTRTGSTGWPASLAEQAYHGLAGDITSALEPHTEADPAAILFQFLAVFGNAIGRGAHHAVEADEHMTNLFVALVGETAKGRKGTSWGHIKRLFERAAPEWSKECVDQGLSSGEGVINRVRDAKEKTIEGESTLVDAGIEDKRLLVVEGELARTIKAISREGNTLSAILRCAWDTGDLNSMTKNNQDRATGAHISVIGHITKDELLRYLRETETSNGFANRFLWICVKRSRCLPEGGSLPASELEQLTSRLSRAIDFGSKAGHVARNEEAREVWRTVYEELSEGKPGLFGAVTGRSEAQVSRLAVIFAVLDLSAVVTRSHMEAALAVWEYAEESAAYIFGASMGDPVADKILAALREGPNGMTRTEISGLFKRNRNVDQICSALALLDERGLARSVTENTGGRSAERWRVTK